VATDQAPATVWGERLRGGFAHRRAAGVAVAVAAAAGAGLLIGLWTPRGPVTTPQALGSIALGLLVGAVAGVAVRSRWALLLAPAVLVAVVEVVRLDSVGPTVDAVRPDGIYGLGALLVGRGFSGLLLLLPVLLGAAVGRAWAVRRRPPRSTAGRLGLAVRRTVALGTAAGLLLLAVALVRPATTEPIRSADGQREPGSVAELSTVAVGGHEQTMLVRGNSVDAPVLLFLAGGPGGFEIGTMSRYARPLEEHFVVVAWDQRGTGASYGALEPAQTLTFDSAVDDTVELAEHLRDRFDEEQVYLLGNSYGTLVGVRAAQERPDLFAALVGAGQMVDIRETDELFYEATLQHAEQTGDSAVVETLRANGPPPYDDPADYLPATAGEHRWNDYSDVPGFPGRREPTESLLVPEYSLVDTVRAVSGLVDTYSVLYPQLQDVDLRTDAPRLDVPVYLVQGRHEAPGRAVPAREWFDLLDAPRKQWFTFDVSGHRPFVQEPERLADVLAGTVLPETDDSARPTPVVAGPGVPEQDELRDLFSRYNEAVWPASALAHALGLAALALVVARPGGRTDRIVALGLAAAWLWVGVGFYAWWAAPPAPAASAAFGAVFVVQAGLLARAGLLRRQLAFRPGGGRGVGFGWAALAYAFVVHPVLVAVLGSGYAETQLVGTAPGPTAVATVGLLLLARPPLPHLLVLPAAWAVLASLSALGQSGYQGGGLVVTAVLAVVALLVVMRRDRARTTFRDDLPERPGSQRMPAREPQDVRP
jgi:proline iminopeptidase